MQHASAHDRQIRSNRVKIGAIAALLLGLGQIDSKIVSLAFDHHSMGWHQGHDRGATIMIDTSTSERAADEAEQAADRAEAMADRAAAIAERAAQIAELARR